METPELTPAELARLVEVYAAGRADALYGRSVASSPQMADLLDRVHAAWMESLCRTSAGLLPFEDTRDERAPDWLRAAQEQYHV